MNEIATISHGEIAPARQSAATKALMPQTFDDVARLAKMMSMASTMVGPVCRGNIGNSAAVIMQGARWGLDPFAISHECFVVNGNLGYGAKLIASVIAANAPIQGRLSYEYSGDTKDRTRSVRVFATFIGETEEKEIQTPSLANIKVQNSPLWKNDPDQQLAYYGARAWARRHAPDIIMGVVTQDEVQDNPDMRNVTPEQPRELEKRLGMVGEEPETDELPDNQEQDTQSKSDASDADGDSDGGEASGNSSPDAIDADKVYSTAVDWIAESKTADDLNNYWDEFSFTEEYLALGDDQSAALRVKRDRKLRELEGVE